MIGSRNFQYKHQERTHTNWESVTWPTTASTSPPKGAVKSVTIWVVSEPENWSKWGDGPPENSSKTHRGCIFRTGPFFFWPKETHSSQIQPVRCLRFYKSSLWNTETKNWPLQLKISRKSVTYWLTAPLKELSAILYQDTQLQGSIFLLACLPTRFIKTQARDLL